MNARTETLPLADLNRFRHGMNAEEGTQLKVYRRRKETNRRRGSGRKTKTRTFHIESRSKNAVPRKSILKSTDERKSDGEERTVRFAENNENAEAGSMYVRRKKIEHRPGSGRSTATRDYRFDRPLKYHPLQHLDANVEENDQGVSDDGSEDFGGFAPDFGDDDGFDVQPSYLEGEMREEANPENAGVFLKKVTRIRGPPNQRLRALMAARQSLMDQGLASGEGGVRRSKRTRVRPLEYWRNEKVVYARQYRSLPTIADVEFRSPDPDWPKPKMKPRSKKAEAHTASNE